MSSDPHHPSVTLLNGKNELAKIVALYMDDNIFLTDDDLFGDIPITIKFDNFPDLLSTFLASSAIDSRKKIYFERLFKPDILTASRAYHKLHNDSIEPMREMVRKKYNNDFVIEKIALENSYGFLPTTVLCRNYLTIRIRDLVYNTFMMLTHPLYKHDIFKPIYDEIFKLVEDITGNLPDVNKFKVMQSYNSLAYDHSLLHKHILAINKQTEKTVKEYTKGKTYIRNNPAHGMLPIFKLTQTGLKIDLPYETARLIINSNGMYIRMFERGNSTFAINDYTKPFKESVMNMDKMVYKLYSNGDVNSLVYPFCKIVECYCMGKTVDWIRMLEKLSTKYYSTNTRAIAQWIARQFEQAYNCQLELVDYRRSEDISIREYVVETNTGSEHKDSLQ